MWCSPEISLVFCQTRNTGLQIISLSLYVYLSILLQLFDRNTLIQQGQIKLNKSYIKDIYNMTNVILKNVLLYVLLFSTLIMDPLMCIKG